MRLIDTKTGMFVETNDPQSYAILSHTWDPQGEQSYQEVREVQRTFAASRARIPAETTVGGGVDANSSSSRTPSLQHNACSSQLRSDESQEHSQPCDRHLLCREDISLKIREACAAALRLGYRLLWIDSCCIDKQSSAELSEAINSMFQWYSLASVCLAYLPDYLDFGILDEYIPLAKRHSSWCCDRHHLGPETRRKTLRRCKWFWRGWTLQELIAPKDVWFLCRHWRVFGTKVTLADTLAAVTGIEAQVLTHQNSFRAVSVADRFSWTSGRETTRVEDEAYSLLGLFDIHMPILYGEGKSALLRLQKEIMQTIPDQTLFAWPSPSHGTILIPESKLHYAYRYDKCGLLTTDLNLFHQSRFAGLGSISQEQLAHRLGKPGALFHPSYFVTPFGVHMHVPLIPVTDVVKTQYIEVHARPAGEEKEYDPEDLYFAILACEATGSPNSLIAMTCHRVRKDASDPAGARKSVQRCRAVMAGLDVATFETTFILSQELLASLRDNGNLHVEWTPISIPLLHNQDSTPQLTPMTSWSPPRGPPTWRNIPALQDLGYTVSYAPSPHEFPHGCQPLGGRNVRDTECL